MDSVGPKGYSFSHDAGSVNSCEAAAAKRGGYMAAEAGVDSRLIGRATADSLHLSRERHGGIVPGRRA